MTETELKLRDAEIQFRLALENTGDEDVVRSCINSMITTARSVTMVMERESAIHDALLSWYKTRIVNLKESEHGVLLKYFNENRTYTIHKGVVTPARLTAQVTDFTKNGVPQPISPDATMIFYRFANPPGDKVDDSAGIFRLCRAYLDVMGALVAEWLVQRNNLLKAGV